MHKAPQTLVNLARGVVEGLSYEFVGLELISRPDRGALLRVYIDQEEGVRLDDCEAVSRQLSGVLDVEDPIRGEYSLEVSSPGLDRPLFEPEHFRRFVGHEARVRLSVPLGGRRKYKGVIAGVVGDGVDLVADGAQLHLPFTQIDSARLVPEY
jgi:ribosome maturation factor RimP